MVVAICDDDQADRTLVGGQLAQKMKGRGEDLEITYFDSGEDLIEQYEDGSRKFDLIFLDICMEFMNGIEAARQIRGYDGKVAIIFLTSSRDYAIDGYSVRASDYLLKPLDMNRLEEAINRFMEERYPRIRQSLLVVGKNTGRRIAYDDIIYIESIRMNLRIVCNNGTEHTIRKKLDDVQAELTGRRFLRCNRSFIVNMDYVADAKDDFTMNNGDKIPIKVREKKQLRKQYFDYIMSQEWRLA